MQYLKNSQIYLKFMNQFLQYVYKIFSVKRSHPFVTSKEILLSGLLTIVVLKLY